MEVHISNAAEAREGTVAKDGNSARITVPPAWHGRRVLVVLLEGGP